MNSIRHDRRQFINAAGVSLAALAGAPELVANMQAAQPAPQSAVAGGTDPDLIVVNATVYTMDARAPRAVTRARPS